MQPMQLTITQTQNIRIESNRHCEWRNNTVLNCILINTVISVFNHIQLFNRPFMVFTVCQLKTSKKYVHTQPFVLHFVLFSHSSHCWCCLLRLLVADVGGCHIVAITFIELYAYIKIRLRDCHGSGRHSDDRAHSRSDISLSMCAHCGFGIDNVRSIGDRELRTNWIRLFGRISKWICSAFNPWCQAIWSEDLSLWGFSGNKFNMRNEWKSEQCQRAKQSSKHVDEIHFY